MTDEKTRVKMRRLEAFWWVFLIIEFVLALMLVWFFVFDYAPGLWWALVELAITLPLCVLNLRAIRRARQIAP